MPTVLLKKRFFFDPQSMIHNPRSFSYYFPDKLNDPTDKVVAAKTELDASGQVAHHKAAKFAAADHLNLTHASLCAAEGILFKETGPRFLQAEPQALRRRRRVASEMLPRTKP